MLITPIQEQTEALACPASQCRKRVGSTGTIWTFPSEPRCSPWELDIHPQNAVCSQCSAPVSAQGWEPGLLLPGWEPGSWAAVSWSSLSGKRQGTLLLVWAVCWGLVGNDLRWTSRHLPTQSSMESESFRLENTFKITEFTRMWGSDIKILFCRSQSTSTR